MKLKCTLKICDCGAILGRAKRSVGIIIFSTSPVLQGFLVEIYCSTWLQRAFQREQLVERFPRNGEASEVGARSGQDMLMFEMLNVVSPITRDMYFV